MTQAKTLTTTIATVFYNLLHHYQAVNSLDEQLVVEALRRSNSLLEDASLTELGDYLTQMDSNQLEGLANNIKGIYHELKYVAMINAQENGLDAEIFEQTNHAGADVIIKDSNTGELLREVQLKATDSQYYINEHIERYPDIDVVATSEVADKMLAVQSSGISNEEISQFVDSQFSQLGDLSSLSQAGDAFVVSGLLGAALRSQDIIMGKKPLTETGKEILVDSGIATAASGIAALLLS